MTFTPIANEVLRDIAASQGQTQEIKMTYPRKVWEFPKSRFVEYEPRDEAWARPLGFGKEVRRDTVITYPRAVITRFEPTWLEFLAMT